MITISITKKKDIQDNSVNWKDHYRCLLGHRRRDSMYCDAKRVKPVNSGVYIKTLSKLNLLFYKVISHKIPAKMFPLKINAYPRKSENMRSTAKLGWAAFPTDSLCLSSFLVHLLKHSMGLGLDDSCSEEMTTQVRPKLS